MLLEHSFITTAERDEALDEAQQVLIRLGFLMERCSDDHVAMVRGVTKAAKAKSIAELPQHVRVEFDRGRVNVAASVEDPRRPGPLHRELLTALATALKSRLGNNLPMPEVIAAVEEVDGRIVEHAVRQKRKRTTIAVILILFIGFVLGFAIVAAN